MSAVARILAALRAAWRAALASWREMGRRDRSGGELLKAMEKAKGGGDARKHPSQRASSANGATKTLEQLGVSATGVPERAGCSWFGCDPDALSRALPRSADEAEEAEAAAWWASHFRQGWRQ
jgi:hypothetical protein